MRYNWACVAWLAMLRNLLPLLAKPPEGPLCAWLRHSMGGSQRSLTALLGLGCACQPDIHFLPMLM